MDSIRHNSDSLSSFDSKILLVNNGTAPISIHASQGKVPCEIVNCGTNLGIAARNIALSNNTSEFLLMMDDDAYISKEHVELMVHAFRSDPSIAAVSFKIRNSQENEACLLPTVFHGCACGFRSSALREIGGYPSDFLYYGEEYCVAFSLYQKGYRIVRLDGVKHIFHAKDNTGRDKNRIIRLLVRNNIKTWSSLFPRSKILTASLDTLQRYALVARKEKAMKGFIMGCVETPFAILSGLRNRTPLSQETFDRIAMVNQVLSTCHLLKSRGIHKAIICSTGKFPSIWLDHFEMNGISVKAFWDTNSCWHGQNIHGIPVVTPDQIGNWETIRRKHDHEQIAWITGTGSLSENDFWKETLSTIGLLPAYLPAAAESAPVSGNFDLLNDCKLSAFIS